MQFWFHQCLIISLYVWLLDGKADKLEGKIVGGEPVSLEKFPSAALFYNVGSQCAGTILGSWIVLTAAHCLDNNKETINMMVEVGARYLYDFNSVQHEVDYFVVHKNYNVSTLFACDIALLFLKKPIQFSKKVKKALLPNTDEWMRAGANHFHAIGWGWTSYGGELSKDGLLMTELDYVTSEACGKMHQLRLSPDMFCLYGHGTKDTCKGDSGGGILWRDMVVGVTSHGDGCAKKNKPSVYANVFYFRTWIYREAEKHNERHCERRNRKKFNLEKL